MSVCTIVYFYFHPMQCAVFMFIHHKGHKFNVMQYLCLCTTLITSNAKMKTANQADAKCEVSV